MCKNIIEKGKCSYDLSCCYAHHESELRPFVDEEEEEEDIHELCTYIR